MSEIRLLICDAGCGRTLTLPTTPEASEPWQRLSIRDRNGELIFKHVCGQCDHTDLIKRMENK